MKNGIGKFAFKAAALTLPVHRQTVIVVGYC